VRRLLATVGCVLLCASPALADGTVRLDPGRAAPTALVAMGLDGRAAALYPRLRKVRLVVTVPDASGAAVGAAPVDVPVARGAVIEGFGIDSAGQVVVLTRAALECSTASLLIRDAGGAWTTAPLGPAPVRAAALAVDPAGLPGVLAIDCAGAMSLLRPGPTGAWVGEVVPGAPDPAARPALALGTGIALVATDGRQPLVLVRSGTGAWAPQPLPGRPLFAGERIVGFSAAVDAAGAPVLAGTRAGPLETGITGTAASTVERRLDRLAAGVWTPITSGTPPVVAVASLGDTLVARRRDGTLLVQHGATQSSMRVDAIAAAAGPGGRIAYVARGAPSVLGLGAPPTMTITSRRTALFGEKASVAVSLVSPAGLPVAGARVRVGGVSGITDVQGRVTLRPVITRTASLDVAAIDPAPVAPVRRPFRIAVRPHLVLLQASLTRNGSRVEVRGVARGGPVLPGKSGKAYLVDLSLPDSGFLPGGVVKSFAGGRPFRAQVTARRGARLAVFFKGALVRLR
jgi:hypothetical protein